MRGMKMQTTKRKATMMGWDAKRPAMPAKHDLLMRREPNHNVHVITHHGKLVVGRKGRKG